MDKRDEETKQHMVNRRGLADTVICKQTGTIKILYPQGMEVPKGNIDNYTINFINGDKYIGQAKDGIPHGNGTFEYKETLPMPLLDGSGWTRESTKSKYVGEFVDGKKHGKGTLFQEVCYYHGEWSNDEPHGSGAFYPTSHPTIYNTHGEVSNGTLNGKGVVLYKNGDEYTGNFVDGQKHGKGVYYHKGKPIKERFEPREYKDGESME